jgi:hypothetical protein
VFDLMCQFPFLKYLTVLPEWHLFHSSIPCNLLQGRSGYNKDFVNAHPILSDCLRLVMLQVHRSAQRQLFRLDSSSSIILPGSGAMWPLFRSLNCSHGGWKNIPENFTLQIK